MRKSTSKSPVLLNPPIANLRLFHSRAVSISLRTRITPQPFTPLEPLLEIKLARPFLHLPRRLMAIPRGQPLPRVHFAVATATARAQALAEQRTVLERFRHARNAQDQKPGRDLAVAPQPDGADQEDDVIRVERVDGRDEAEGAADATTAVRKE